MSWPPGTGTAFSTAWFVVVRVRVPPHEERLLVGRPATATKATPILVWMSVTSRLPELFLLAIVLIAAGLLIAGYGAAVGVGVIVGLILGGAAVLAVVAMSQRSGRSAGFSWGAGDGSSDQSVQLLMERHGRDSMRVAGVDQGVLRRVIAVGTAADAGGAHVELVAVEIREDGGIATLVAHVRPPLGYVGQFLEAVVTDDASTGYVASSQTSGGSSPGATRHEIRFSPAPPDAARTLIVRIEQFDDPFTRGSDPITGPWEFRVALGADR